MTSFGLPRLGLSLAALMTVLGLYAAIALSVQTITAEPPWQLDMPFELLTGIVLLGTAVCAFLATWITAVSRAVGAYLIGLGLLLGLLGLDEMLSVHESLWRADEVGLLIWAGLGALILMLVRRSRLDRTTQLVLQAGWVVHGLASFLDTGDGGIFVLDGIPLAAIRWSTQVLELVCATLYAVGFPLMRCATSDTRRAQSVRPIAQAAGILVETVRRLAAIALVNLDYRIWRLSHPGRSFANYYAESIARKLQRGAAHPTLGRRERRRGAASLEPSAERQARRGRKVANRLITTMRLPRDAVVVDYGCGSLRVGKHFIAHLDAGCYWGLDVTDTFYREGLALLPPDLVASKQPHLAVIDDATLRRVRAAEPAFIFSVSVLMHIPESEIDAFIQRLAALKGPRTTVAVSFDEARSNCRTHGRSWAYNAAWLEAAFRARLPEARITIESGKVEGHLGPVQIRRSLLWLDLPASDSTGAQAAPVPG